MGSSPRDGLQIDPRVRRTRRLLHDALAALLSEKDFERISVLDIAQASTLNRATFYDHYTDKQALLNCLIGTRFRESVERRRLTFSGCSGATRAMFMGICDSFAEMPGADSRQAMEKSHESAIVSTVRAMVHEGVSAHMSAPAYPIELLASTVAWAIYGAAREWLREPNGIPAEAAAETVEQLVGAMLAPAPKPIGP